MIRKPKSDDFRDAAAVVALRSARDTAVAGARKTRSVLRTILSVWIFGTLAFGFLMTLVTRLAGL